MIRTALQLIYGLLLLTIVGDLWSFKGMPTWAQGIHKTLRVVTWPLTRPFQGIIKTKVDLSALVALIIIVYLADPLLRSIFK